MAIGNETRSIGEPGCHVGHLSLGSNQIWSYGDKLDLGDGGAQQGTQLRYEVVVDQHAPCLASLDDILTTVIATDEDGSRCCAVGLHKGLSSCPGGCGSRTFSQTFADPV